MTRRLDRRVYPALALALIAVFALVFLRTPQVATTSVGSESPHGRGDTAPADEPAKVDLATLPVAEEETRRALSTPVTEAIAPDDLELFIGSSDGAPVPKADLVIFRDDEILAFATTDAEGLARVHSATGAAEVAVFAPGWVVARAPVELAPGRRTITLPAGSILGGRVLVDGAPPTEPIELKYFRWVRPWALTALPARVLERLRPSLELHGDLYALTDANGAFVFRGLPSTATGTLEWQGPYFVDQVDMRGEPSEAHSVNVDSLRPDLELRLVRGLELRLRVVDPDGLPVPLALVSGTVTHMGRSGPTTARFGGVADVEGRYRSSLGRKPAANVDLRVARPDGFGAVAREIPCPPGTRGAWDLGDLAIAPTRVITVHVLDSQGTPIANALALPAHSDLDAGSRSDVKGDLQLSLGPDDVRILVLALGFESACVDAPPDAVDVTARLARACGLEFTLRDGDGVDRGELTVKVTGDPPLFIDETRGGLPSLPFTKSTMRSMAEGGTARFTTAPVDGRWKVAGLRPGVALKADLRSWNGPVLAHAELAPLEPGELRVVELALSRPPKSLSVRILDPARRPLPAAHLHLSESFRGSDDDPQVSTNSNGLAEFKSLYADRFRLEVKSEAFPTKILRGLSIPPEELTVVLDAPRSVEVELVTLDGAPAAGQAEVSALGEEVGFRRGEPTAPGRWILKDLPTGEISIRARSDAFPETQRLHDTSESSVRIIVGGLGRVMVRLKYSDYDYPPGGWSLAICRRGSEAIHAREVMRGGWKDGLLQAGFSGLPFGKYDIWLVTRAQEAPCDWTRVGSPLAVELDAEHPLAELETHP